MDYIGPYSPEAYASGDPEGYTDDTSTSTNVSWLSSLSNVIKSAGQAAQGILQTQQGVVVDAYGRVVSVGGKAVTSYNTSTLGGVVSGMSLTSLLLIGVVIWLALKK